MIKKVFKYFPVFLLSAIIFLLPDCKKDNSTIPNVSVDIYLYLTQPESFDLNTVGGWVYVPGGVKGIIVFRKSINEFVAYERDCPYDPDVSAAKIDVDSSGVIGVDNHCGSKFSLFDNTILNGPATRGLKAYYTEYNSSNQTVYIHN
jgi:hypothetical protein